MCVLLGAAGSGEIAWRMNGKNRPWIHFVPCQGMPHSLPSISFPEPHPGVIGAHTHTLLLPWVAGLDCEKP